MLAVVLEVLDRRRYRRRHVMSFEPDASAEREPLAVFFVLDVGVDTQQLLRWSQRRERELDRDAGEAQHEVHDVTSNRASVRPSHQGSMSRPQHC